MIRRTITISPELDMAIAKLATESGSNYSKYISDRLIMNDTIKEIILRLEKLPQMPELTTEEITKQQSTPMTIPN